MTTPKTLSDLRYETTARTTNHTDTITKARRWFADCGLEGEVKVRELFREEDEITAGSRTYHERVIVYECYVDSGSDDYLYIIQQAN